MTNPALSVRAVALLVVAMLVAACGLSTRDKVLRSTITTTNAARAAFLAWDDRVQDGIIAEATTLEAGQAALDAHRARRATLVAAFEAVYYALALAATRAGDVELADVLAASARLRAVYREITGADPP